MVEIPELSPVGLSVEQKIAFITVLMDYPCLKTNSLHEMFAPEAVESFSYRHFWEYREYLMMPALCSPLRHKILVAHTGSREELLQKLADAPDPFSRLEGPMLDRVVDLWMKWCVIPLRAGVIPLPCTQLTLVRYGEPQTAWVFTNETFLTYLEYDQLSLF